MTMTGRKIALMAALGIGLGCLAVPSMAQHFARPPSGGAAPHIALHAGEGHHIVTDGRGGVYHIHGGRVRHCDGGARRGGRVINGIPEAGSVEFSEPRTRTAGGVTEAGQTEWARDPDAPICSDWE